MRTIAATVLLVILSVVVVAQDDEEPAQDEVELSDDAQALLEKMDADGDGKLSGDEIPKRGKRFLLRHDKNDDGVLEGDELNEVAGALAKLKDAAEDKRQDDIADAMGEEYEADEASGLFLEAARDYNKATNGEALYIMKDGKLVFEAYDNGYQKDREHQLASGTKSFNGIIAAMAVQDGLIKWDERVCETITEWAEDDRNAITVRMLLSLCAGLPPEQDALQGPQTENKYDYAVNLELKHKPDTKFEYGPAQYFAWGEFLRRKLAASGDFKEMNLTDYFMHRIGDKLGMEMTWRTDRAGNPSTPHGIYITADEWAKFGEFVRLGGKIGDEQVLKTELMDECFKPSECNPGYGLTWWLGGSESEEGDSGEGAAKDALGNDVPETPEWMPKDLVFAAGKGKQRLYVSRELGLTIVRFADDTGSFVNEEFLSWLLRGKAP